MKKEGVGMVPFNCHRNLKNFTNHCDANNVALIFLNYVQPYFGNKQQQHHVGEKKKRKITCTQPKPFKCREGDTLEETMCVCFVLPGCLG